jgi:hypothetical protein
MLFLLQQPIVVDVAQQPPETARISYSEVILSAFGVAGAIMVLAALVGIAVGAFIVHRKKREEATAPGAGTGHTRRGI